MPELPRTLTAALHQEEDWYIAQCLEVDVARQGHTIDEALSNLAEAVALYLDEVGDPQRHVTATPLVTSFQLPEPRRTDRSSQIGRQATTAKPWLPAQRRTLPFRAGRM